MYLITQTRHIFKLELIPHRASSASVGLLTMNEFGPMPLLMQKLIINCFLRGAAEKVTCYSLRLMLNDVT